MNVSACACRSLSCYILLVPGANASSWKSRWRKDLSLESAIKAGAAAAVEDGLGLQCQITNRLSNAVQKSGQTQYCFDFERRRALQRKAVLRRMVPRFGLALASSNHGRAYVRVLHPAFVKTFSIVSIETAEKQCIPF